MNKLMQQAQQMQQKMAKIQEGLKDKTVDAQSGGGMVKVVFNGHQELMSIAIDASVVDPAEVDFLEDLILSAVQEGHKKAGSMAADEMKQATGGMPLPGGMF